ncbi:hypothetical protein [Archangium lansingense]|uniref:Uncharacterized protein n=1 Tax=Archangium lansingense TaxID=2995310 RepID=A0ABT4ALE0_9BACT|nr:hypothetical protein [Archangium lansinium]MCY1082516.1 hypothetical protein [Archangium lansinium]
MQIFIAVTDPKLLGEEPFPNQENLPHNGQYVFSEEGSELSRAERQALAKSWVAPENYTPMPPRKCLFNPNIALRFWRGKTWVDAVVCFTCHRINFLDEQGNSINPGFLQDFGLLGQLSRRAFPGRQFMGLQ